MVYERSIDIGSGTKLTMNTTGVQEDISLESAISTYYNYIMSNLTVILQSNDHNIVINTAKLVQFGFNIKKFYFILNYFY